MNLKLNFEQAKALVESLNTRMNILIKHKSTLWKSQKEEFAICFDLKWNILNMVVDADLGLPSINWFYKQCEISKQLKDCWLNG